jgi:GT2 family glycosyltransferase
LYTVIIPSGSMENLAACVARLREERVVVLRHSPFSFPRACNAGIAAAGNDDVILLNDDALLLTPEGFREMERLAAAHPEFGIISSSVIGDVCNQEQLSSRPGQDFWEASRPMVAFICVYVPRSTIAQIGNLDERFTGYGYDDDDFCRRVREAGLKIGVSGKCCVEHRSRPSVFRSGASIPAAKYQEMFAHNRRLYEQKWATGPVAQGPLSGLAGLPAKPQDRTAGPALPEPLLSILVCGLESRRHLAEGVLASLRAQIAALANPETVELLYLVDRGQDTVGVKRNRLIAMARGQYVAFVDDDDRVMGDYLAKMLEAISKGPDCVGITGFISYELNGPPLAHGRHLKFFRQSLDCQDRNEGPDIITDTPHHLCAIRADIAKRVPFPALNCGEDSAWKKSLRPFLKTCVMIEDPIYYYDFRFSRTATQVSAVEARRRASAPQP